MTTKTEEFHTFARIDRCAVAMFAGSMPCNPIPFALSLADLVCEAEDSDSIKSDKAKRILWVLIAQSYGQLSKIDLCAEWSRLDKAFNHNEKIGAGTC